MCILYSSFLYRRFFLSYITYLVTSSICRLYNMFGAILNLWFWDHNQTWHSWARNFQSPLIPICCEQSRTIQSIQIYFRRTPVFWHKPWDAISLKDLGYSFIDLERCSVRSKSYSCQLNYIVVQNRMFALPNYQFFGINNDCRSFNIVVYWYLFEENLDYLS